jgi:hypothetical protein
MAKDSPDDYTVGYGKPPVARRFRRGVSGNPKGRPRGSKNLDQVLLAELTTKIWITENGSRISITKFDAMFKQLVNRALGGNERAIKLILEAIRQFESKELERDDTRISVKAAQGIIRAADLAEADRVAAERAQATSFSTKAIELKWTN